MTLRRISFLLVFLVVAGAAGCASSGTQGGAYSTAGAFDDCGNLYPPGGSLYSISYGLGYYDDALCPAYPRGEYYPEAVVPALATRQITVAEPREHRAHRVLRPGDSGWSASSGSGSSDSSWSSSFGGGATVPRMEPIPVSSPSAPGGSSGPGPGTVTVQPREH